MALHKATVESVLGPGRAFGASERSQIRLDSISPEVVAYPASVEEVSTLLQLAFREKLAVVPWGRGAYMPLGNPLERLDMVVCLEPLNRVVEHEPADLTVTVEAGISMGHLQEALAPYGQYVPLDPPFLEKATVGGILAANMSGPRRLFYRTAQDWVLGTKVVGATGDVARAGGKVVKNVAGYDLNKLYIGSLGTLAIIVEVTLKLVPLPKSLRTLLLGLSSLDEAILLAFELRDQGLQPLAVELLDASAVRHLLGQEDVPALLAVELGGVPEAVERQDRDIAGLARQRAASLQVMEEEAWQQAFWRRLRNFAREGDKADLVLKSSLPPARIGEFLKGVETISLGKGMSAALVCHILSGIVYSFLWASEDEKRLAQIVEENRRVASRLEGHTLVESCPLWLKKAIDVFGEPEQDFSLMRRVKEQFDPARVLSPGRFLGRL